MASCQVTAHDLGVHRVSLGHVKATMGQWDWDHYKKPSRPCTNGFFHLSALSPRQPSGVLWADELEM